MTRHWRGQHVLPPHTPHARHARHAGHAGRHAAAAAARLRGGRHQHVRLREPRADGGQADGAAAELPRPRQGECHLCPEMLGTEVSAAEMSKVLFSGF